MVITQFQTVLGENGIEEISPGKGDAYDHNLHEAVQTQPSDEVEAGAVLQLVRRGFSLNGRLIRPATVIVSGEASE
jgi:molecular chaperone GrpE